ncbi:hypothetical protein LEP1GSC016_1532, partial [Leptospira borgpetersenii serovar Hardjo-bovis str. Sponselee]
MPSRFRQNPSKSGTSVLVIPVCFLLEPLEYSPGTSPRKLMNEPAV